jgi:hypothetical protein
VLSAACNLLRNGRLGQGGQALVAVGLLCAMALALDSSKPRGHWKPKLYRLNVLAPEAGRAQIFPRDALDGIALVRAYKLRRFRPGPVVFKKFVVMVRLVEGAHPALGTMASTNVIDYPEGIDPAVCTVVAVRGRMAFARCRE